MEAGTVQLCGRLSLVRLMACGGVEVSDRCSVGVKACRTARSSLLKRCWPVADPGTLFIGMLFTEPSALILVLTSAVLRDSDLRDGQLCEYRR